MDNIVEEASCNALIMDSGRVAEARLIKKYQGIRFFDDDDDEDRYFRIRSDRFTWIGKRSGGWVIVCDTMPDKDPAHDPIIPPRTQKSKKKGSRQMPHQYHPPRNDKLSASNSRHHAISTFKQSGEFAFIHFFGSLVKN